MAAGWRPMAYTLLYAKNKTTSEAGGMFFLCLGDISVYCYILQ